MPPRGRLHELPMRDCRFLAALPRLREVALDGVPKVTLQGIAVFPARVRVNYSA